MTVLPLAGEGKNLVRCDPRYKPSRRAARPPSMLAVSASVSPGVSRMWATARSVHG